MAGYSRSSGIGSKNDTRLRRAVASVSRRTAISGSAYYVSGGVVIDANKLREVDSRYERDGLFIRYAPTSEDAYGFSFDADGRLVVNWTDQVDAGVALALYWSESDGAYVLNLYNTIVAQFTATTIYCGSLYADSGDFDYVRINASSGPTAGIPATGECVVYMQTSGGVDYLRAKFKSGAVREIANSSHNLIQVDGIGIDGGIPGVGEIAFDASATIYAGGGELAGDLTLACYGLTGDIILSPVDKIVIDGDTLVITTSKTPAGALAEGDEGQFVWDDDYLYVRVSDRWKRIALSVFSVAVLAVDGTEVSVDGTAIGVDQ